MRFTHLKFVGKRSTITQYTVLMPKDVNASNIQDNTKFSIELWTKYSPMVTAPATTKLNTEMNNKHIIRLTFKSNHNHNVQT